MTTTTGFSTAEAPRANAGRPVEISGAQVRARCHHVATVVTITGNVSVANLERIANYCARLILAGKPMVLDITGVQGSAASCIRLVKSLDAHCNKAGLELVAAAGGAVLDRLDSAVGGKVSIVTAVPAALSYFTEALRARRQLLLPLFAKTA